MAIAASAAAAEPGLAPTNDLPNPYATTLAWEKLPAGRRMGAAAAIQIDPDGRSVWVAERCGANTCEGSDLPMVLKLDPQGHVVRAFGAGELVTPHGMAIDRQGDIWVTDMGIDKAQTHGQVVVKFSPEGKVLMRLGVPGQAGSGPDRFRQPCGVAVAPNGDIFVSDSHSDGADANARILKFSPQGRFIKSWGHPGSGPGEFHIPHAMAFDPDGRLLVADRGNNRIQVFDQDGRYITEWRQFSRPSGLYVRNGLLYVSDSESNAQNHPGGWRRGVRVGDARTGRLLYFAPQLPASNPDASPSGMEGIAVDASGSIYGANVYLRDYFPGGGWGEIRKFQRQRH